MTVTPVSGKLNPPGGDLMATLTLTEPVTSPSQTEWIPSPRSLYRLRGEVRSEWEHSIPPVEALRYSVTFRSLAPIRSLAPVRRPAASPARAPRTH